MKRLLSIIICISILAGISGVAAASDGRDAIKKTIIALGIMTGDGNGNLSLARNVTRAEFAKMMVWASEHKDTARAGSGVSPFRDVRHTHWAADYINTAVNANWIVGFLDGSYRPDQTINYEQAATAVLRMLGFDTSDLSGAYPYAQISKFAALELDKGISPAQGQALTRNECMHIFFNLMGATTKGGEIYGATLGYAMNSDGEIDYDALVGKGDVEGPFVIADRISSVIPFDASDAVIYRNNRLSAADSIIKYDVAYYNEYTKTVWAYSDRAVGLLTAVSPNAVSPESVTVAGNAYALGTEDARDKLSARGGFAVGDTVALLLGMDGDAVDVIPGAEIDATYYGVVIKHELATYPVGASGSIAEFVITVACTDGTLRQVAAGDADFSEGDAVSISYAGGSLAVGKLVSSRLSGTVDSAGKRLGDYAFSDDIEIMDVSKDGGWAIIAASRLSGARLDLGSVIFYALSSGGEITHLMLSDATGDMYSYGILTDIENVVAQESLNNPPLPDSDRIRVTSVVYSYMINGTSGMLNSTRRHSVARGPAIFYYTDGQISQITNLARISIDALSEMSALSGNRRHSIADGVEVYIRSASGAYYLTELSAVNAAEYTLSGYHETIYPAGGQIRLIIASRK